MENYRKFITRQYVPEATSNSLDSIFKHIPTMYVLYIYSNQTKMLCNIQSKFLLPEKEKNKKKTENTQISTVAIEQSNLNAFSLFASIAPK